MYDSEHKVMIQATASREHVYDSEHKAMIGICSYTVSAGVCLRAREMAFQQMTLSYSSQV